MCERSANRKHEIGLRNERRGVGEIGKLRSEMFNIRLTCQKIEIVGKHIALDNDPAKTVVGEERREFLERNRADSIFLVARTARARDGDRRFFPTRKTRAPF